MYLKQITNLHYDKGYRWQLTCWTVSLTYKGKGKWNINNTEMTKLANVDRADCQFLTQLMDDRQSNLYQVSPLNLFLRFDKATSFFFRGLRLKKTEEESCWFGLYSAKWFFQEPSIGVKKNTGCQERQANVKCARLVQDLLFSFVVVVVYIINIIIFFLLLLVVVVAVIIFFCYYYYHHYYYYYYYHYYYHYYYY